jgi:DNA-binding response OmpR family regulator
MNEQRRSALILDLDADTLVRLEQLLEDAGFATFTTWDPAEGRELMEGNSFDYLILGDHPPELDAAMFLREVRPRECRSMCLVMRSDPRRSEEERFEALGAVVVISKYDVPSVLEQLRMHCRLPALGPNPKPVTATDTEWNRRNPLDAGECGRRPKTA